MAGFQQVLDALLVGESKKGKERIDILRSVLSLSNTQLAIVANNNGDHGLLRLTKCRCLDRLRRMAAVGSHGTREGMTFDIFTRLISGAPNEDSPPRRRPVGRR